MKNLLSLLMFIFLTLSKKVVLTNNSIIVSFLTFVLLEQRTKAERLNELNTCKSVIRKKNLVNSGKRFGN